MPALMGWMGAFSSLALVAGLGFWVYDLATRDARSVPVVRALEGPSRLAPENPGGFEAAHQGYEVNRIASEKGDEAPLADRVVLAPDQVGPEAGDLPVAAAKAPPADPAEALRSAVEGALSEVLGLPSPAAPGADEEEEGGGASGADPDAAADETGSEEGADAAALFRPVPRPGATTEISMVTRASASAQPAVLVPAVAVEVDPGAIESGSRLVQFGAYETRAEADAAWMTLAAGYSDYLALHPKVVEETTVNGRVFYRLRAFGFNDLNAARNFCAMLVAEKVDCIPVLTQ